MVAAQPLVGAEQLARVRGELAERCALALHHVLVEVGRTTDRLTRVVDDEVEPVARGEQLVTERLDARRVPQIETEDLETITPLGEVGLLRVARSGVAREARRHNESRACAQELESRLVADLDAPTGEQRHAAAQVGELRSLHEVDLRASRAELIVEVMDGREVLLAHVAVDRLAQLPRCAARRRSRRTSRAGTRSAW